MQNAEGLQLGLLSILRARGKSCLRLPDGQYTGNKFNKLCNNCKNRTGNEDPMATCCMFGIVAGLQGAEIVALRDSLILPWLQYLLSKISL